LCTLHASPRTARSFAQSGERPPLQVRPHDDVDWQGKGAQARTDALKHVHAIKSLANVAYDESKTTPQDGDQSKHMDEELNHVHAIKSLANVAYDESKTTPQDGDQSKHMRT
jgi:hypothetical protein